MPQHMLVSGDDIDHVVRATLLRVDLPESVLVVRDHAISRGLPILGVDPTSSSGGMVTTLRVLGGMRIDLIRRIRIITCVHVCAVLRHLSIGFDPRRERGVNSVQGMPG